MNTLWETSNRLIREVTTDFYRYLYQLIDWNLRLIEITGSRGVGKTTLLLQRANQMNKTSEGSALYISLDNPWFYSHTLLETAEKFFQGGGMVLFIDEVHKYPAKHPGHDWSAEVKNIYDQFPKLLIVYSGSSVLQLYRGSGDLSRRKVTYNLKGLSFREYLSLNRIIDFPLLSLDDLFIKQSSFSLEIADHLRILPHFRNYLKTGYYPFFKEAPDHYFSRLNEVIGVILENDLPTITDITFDTISKIKKLLAVIAGSVPYTLNHSRVREELHIADHRTLLKYFHYLDKAEVITILNRESKGNQMLRKPDKIYLNNPNLLGCFFSEPEIGTVRETFVISQLKKLVHVSYPEKGDFLIEQKWIVEVGGRSKTGEQIKGIPNSFLALDDVETGSGRTIPLWLFGFLY